MKRKLSKRDERFVEYVKKWRESKNDSIDELTLMLDIFNSCIVNKALPEINSPCQLKVLELMARHDRKPTA